MRLLLIGLSSIATRRILPALAAADGITGVDIASRSQAPQQDWSKRGQFFQDYTRALNESDAEVVYISLPNAHHEEWILKAIQSGKHVIVDKPATMTLAGAEACLKAAKSRSLLLAEATVFSYHPHFVAVRDFLIENGPLTHLEALFIIPPLPANNFRNDLDLGGGCLLDMGPYAAALARLFGDELERLCVLSPAVSRPRVEVDKGFSLGAEFANGLRFTGHFSFESEYHNRITAIARGGAVTVDRVFSPPPDVTFSSQARRRNVAEVIETPSNDAFRLFIDGVVTAISNQDHHEFTTALLQDAHFRARIDSAIEHGHT